MKSDKPYPLSIGFHFVRGSKHKFDFHNAVQIIADLLVAHDFIEDDNMDCLIPYPLEINGKYYTYDSKNPGVYISIFNKIKMCKC
jgi:galactose-1-phosphate uridylyltransferase